MSREQWLEARRQGIGASDSPAILGVSRWRTPLHVYLDKVGELPPTPPTPEQIAGLELEPYIAKMYQRQIGEGWAVYRPEGQILANAETPWLLASPDFVAVPVGLLPRRGHLLECKTAQFDDGWGEPGTDQVPREYWVQAQQQMHCSGMFECVVALLLRGVEFRTYPVQYDEKFCREMVAILAEFWDRVQKRNPPAPNWDHPKTPDLMKLVVGPQVVDMEDAVDVDDTDLLGNLMEYQALKDQIKRLSERKEALYAEILTAVAATPKAVVNGRMRVNLIKAHRKAYEVQACDYLQMRVSEVKSK